MTTGTAGDCSVPVDCRCAPGRENIVFLCHNQNYMDLSAHLGHRVFRVIAEVAARERVEAFVVGGFVRDLLLQGDDFQPKDIDVVVIGSGIEMAEKVRETLEGEVHFSVYRNFGRPC